MIGCLGGIGLANRRGSRDRLLGVAEALGSETFCVDALGRRRLTTGAALSSESLGEPD